MTPLGLGGDIVSRTPNVFTDPATGETYAWQFNHLTEGGGLARNLTVSSPTSLGILIRQQAADGAVTLAWSGTALTRHQHQQFLLWYQKCKHHSIFLTDFAGDQFEVVITAYDPKRKAVAVNPRERNSTPSVGAPLWVYDFTLTMEIIRAIAGDYAGVL